MCGGGALLMPQITENSGDVLHSLKLHSSTMTFKIKINFDCIGDGACGWVFLLFNGFYGLSGETGGQNSQNSDFIWSRLPAGGELRVYFERGCILTSALKWSSGQTCASNARQYAMCP